MSRRTRELLAARDKGATKQDALDSMLERGEFDISFVADQIYRSSPDSPHWMIDADVRTICRRVNETGSIY